MMGLFYSRSQSQSDKTAALALRSSPDRRLHPHRVRLAFLRLFVRYCRKIGGIFWQRSRPVWWLMREKDGGDPGLSGDSDLVIF